MPHSPPSAGADISALLAEAERLSRSGALREAECVFRAAVAAEHCGCRARNGYGCFLLRTERFAAAAEQLSAAWETARRTGDERMRAAVCNNLAIAFRCLGDASAAHSLQQQSVSAESGEQDGMSACDLANLANDALLAGRLDLAEDLVTRSLRREQALGNQEGEASDWGTLGIIHGLRCNFASAVDCLGRAYALHRALNDLPGIGTDLLNLGELCLRMGRPRTAERLLLRAAARFHRAGTPGLEGRAVALLNVARRMAAVRERDPSLN